MSTDLAAFLHARITEDEEAARRWREDEHEWQVVGRRHLTYQSGSGENVAAIDVTNQPCMWWERIYVKGDVGDLADHIARHDPARVLADCAAKHAILQLHQPVTYTNADLGIHNATVCFTCHSHLTEPDDWPDTEEWGYPLVQDQWPCRTARALAQPWADHPDYQPAWTAT
jgi:hypothetical protein